MPSPAPKPQINQVLADNLRHFMAEREVKQVELARKAGMGQTTVSLYLNPQNRKAGKSGKQPSAKLADIESLANALGVQLWELLRPLTDAEREFYRSMDALLAQKMAAPLAGPKKRTGTDG